MENNVIDITRHLNMRRALEAATQGKGRTLFINRTDMSIMNIIEDALGDTVVEQALKILQSAGGGVSGDLTTKA